MSAVLASWDAPSSSLAWLRCGHPPPWSGTPSAGCARCEGGDGPVLGLTGWIRRASRGPATIAPDELVVLVSDGVLERAAPGADAFGEDGLRRALERWRRRRPPRRRRRCSTPSRRSDDGPLRDDASVLVLAPADGPPRGDLRGAPRRSGRRGPRPPRLPRPRPRRAAGARRVAGARRAASRWRWRRRTPRRTSSSSGSAAAGAAQAGHRRGSAQHRERAGRARRRGPPGRRALSLLTMRPARVRRVLRGLGAPRYAAMRPRRRHAFVSDGVARRARGRGPRAAGGSSRASRSAPARATSPSIRPGACCGSRWGRAPRPSRWSTSAIRCARALRRRVRPPFLAHDVAFSPSGRRVWITAGRERRLAVLPAAGGRPVLLGADAAPQHVSFGRGVAYVASGDGASVRVHDLAARTRAPHRARALRLVQRPGRRGRRRHPLPGPRNAHDPRPRGTRPARGRRSPAPPMTRASPLKVRRSGLLVRRTGTGWGSTDPEVPVAPIQLTVQHPDFDTVHVTLAGLARPRSRL